MHKTTEVRDAYRNLVVQGWTDALRALYPDERIYTFWKYFRNAFARDAGLRIDHLLLSPPVAGRLVAAGVHRDVRARDRASDHAPVRIELADANAGSPGPAPHMRKARRADAPLVEVAKAASSGCKRRWRTPTSSSTRSSRTSWASAVGQ
jgi:hypothetical protein